jgi:hypothetical protein
VLEFFNAAEHNFNFEIKYFTMDRFKQQFDGPSFGQLKVASQTPLRAKQRKGYSQVEINKALTLLGFNTWTALEPSKSLEYSSLL